MLPGHNLKRHNVRTNPSLEHTRPMSSPDFLVVFAGKPLDGFEPLAMRTQVEAMLRLKPAQSEKLFSGQPVVIKRTQDKAAALTLARELKSLGADVSVRVAPKTETEASAPDAPKVPAPPSTHSEPPETDAGLSLKANEGFLVDPAPEASPPVLDLSGLTAEPIGETPLAPVQTIDAPALDLSGLSVSELDDAPLMETADDPVPIIDTPDFGLDAPGALLETVGQSEPVPMPDLSALSVRASDGDLLDASEKTDITVKAIDTSGLEVQPN